MIRFVKLYSYNSAMNSLKSTSTRDPQGESKPTFRPRTEVTE